MSGATIVYADDETSTAALFGKSLQSTQDYIATTVQNYTNHIGTGAGNIVNSVIDRFQQIRSSEAVQKVANMRSRLNSLWQTNSIRRIPDIPSMQQAPIEMQKLIMAHPGLRQAWNRGGASGWDGQYVDQHPNTIGNSHYDYRRVMDGVVEVKEDGASYTQYYEQLITEEDLLSLVEKTAVLSSWSVLDKSLAESDTDPTSVWNEKLG